MKLSQTPLMPVERIVVVPATELDIQAAIVILRKRSLHFGVPIEVKAFPHNPVEGWRQAALSFIRKNQEEAEKGHGILI